MAVTYYVSAVGQAIVTCLSTDTKPVSPPDDWVLFELDGPKRFRSIGGSWVQANTSVWGSMTGTLADQTDLQAVLDGKQPIDSDLTTIAGLTPTTDNFMVAAASAWASRTPAQAKTSLALVKGDVGLGNVDNTSDANKPVSTAQQTALDLKAPLISPTLVTPVLGAATATSVNGAVLSNLLGTAVFLNGAGAYSAPVASVSITEAEIDLGTTPVAEASVAVVDLGVTTSSKIIGGVAYKAPTDKDLDELEMDAIEVKFEPGTASLNVHIKGLEGYLSDKFKVWYTFA